jgi:CRP-like cAMP-binding protein
MDQALSALKEFLYTIHPLSDEAWQAFASGWQLFSAKRKTVLTPAGETERHLYFVLEGVQRAFYQSEGNREVTIVFTYPPSFSGVADSFLTQTPSAYFLETLTASRFLRTGHVHVMQMMQDLPMIRELIFKVTAMTLKGVLRRQIELQCYSNEEKFKTLMSRSPHLLNLVPHKYIASYLGMDATNFSKLLGTVRI